MAASVFTIITCGVTAVLNLIQMNLFQGIIARDFAEFIFWMVIDLCGWLLYFVFRSIQIFFQGRAVKEMNNQLRRDISVSLLNKSYQDYHARDKGEYLSWYTNHINQIQKYGWEPFFDMVGFIAQVCWSILILAYLHWSLLAASLVVSVIMMLLPKIFAGKMERLGKDCSSAQAKAVSQWKDLLSGYSILRFFGLDVRFIEQSADASENLEGVSFRQKYIQGFVNGGLGFVTVLCQLCINALIGYLSIKGIIIQSALFGGGNLCSAVSNGLNDIADARLSFASGKPYFDMVTVHAEAEQEKEEICSPIREAITVEHLYFGYGEKEVLKDVNMHFEKNKKYALVGTSGCGKSTLLKILLGWLPEYTGTIRFDGKDARSYTMEQLQQQMSYIEQDVFLFNTSIRENITLGRDFSEKELQRAIHDSALSHDLENMPDGLDTNVGEEGSALSGGQKQRVAIARALIHNRSILLVDEGTSALDNENAEIVEKSLLSNPDLTLILISHHLTQERKEQFDQVYAM